MDELPPNPYSDADIAILSNDLRIGLDSSKALASGLREAAHRWEQNTIAPTVNIRPKDLRNDLETLSNTLNAADVLLQNLTEAQWEMMHNASAHFNSDPYKSRIEMRADANDPGVLTKTVELFSQEQETRLTVQNIREALSVLSEDAFYGAYMVSNANKRGPQEDFPLKAWVVDIRSFCFRTLRVPFTCDESRGTPISDAACFCVHAYAVLSPETSSKRVLTAMKKEISLQAEMSREFMQNRD